MQNFDIEVEGNRITRELLLVMLRQFMNSLGHNPLIYVEEKSCYNAQQPLSVSPEGSPKSAEADF